MSDTVRTRSQLLASFADNVTFDITAQNGRDFIQGAFGYVGTSDPSVNNDNVDTAGIGAFFDAGSCWFNTSTQKTWFCFSGAPGAAVWSSAGTFPLTYTGGSTGGVTTASPVSVAFFSSPNFLMGSVGVKNNDPTNSLLLSWYMEDFLSNIGTGSLTLAPGQIYGLSSFNYDATLNTTPPVVPPLIILNVFVQDLVSGVHAAWQRSATGIYH